MRLSGGVGGRCTGQPLLRRAPTALAAQTLHSVAGCPNVTQCYTLHSVTGCTNVTRYTVAQMLHSAQSPHTVSRLPKAPQKIGKVILYTYIVPCYWTMWTCEHNIALGCGQWKQIELAKASVFAQGIFDNCVFCLYLVPLIFIPSVHVSNTYCSGVFYAVQYYQ